MPFIIDGTGATAQDLDEIIGEIDAELTSPEVFGPDFVLDESEPIPQLRAVLAGREARLQQALVALTKTHTPGEARGVWQDNLLDIFGLERLQETYSTVLVELTGPAPGTIPAGRVYRHIPSQTLWDQPTSVATTGDPATGQTTLVAQEPGPVDITASDQWEIVQGDVNVTAVESIAQSEPGRLTEQDEVAEERRRTDVAGSGSATEGAISADVLSYLRDAGYGSSIDEVSVEVNDEPVEVDGRGPHSVEVLVDDNSAIPNDVIAQAVWEAVGAGPTILGDESGTAVDAAVRPRTVRFSRTGQVEVWVRITIGTAGAEVDLGDTEALFPAIEAALVDWASTAHPVDRDVIPLRFSPTVQATAPEGSITSLTVELSLDGIAYDTAVVEIGPTDRAVFALDRTEVTQ